jgi:hypothetical protein
LSLFFDADWFDARLAEKGLDRGALAASAGLNRETLHQIVINERQAAPAELAAFAELLGVDMIEISLRSGISTRPAPSAETDAAARLDDLDARLDRIDRWLETLGERKRPEEDHSSPALGKVAGKG